MASRRPHRKSRNGCLNCKERHVKVSPAGHCPGHRAVSLSLNPRHILLTSHQCDQRGPPCVNCQVRELSCKPVECDKHPVAIRASPIHDPAHGSHAMELELMHWWSTATYRSFSFQPDDSEIWQVILVRDALENRFLLDSIFAITSLHVAMTGPSTKASTYNLSALRYHNTAIKLFQEHDVSITASNSQATFAFTMVNVAIVIALPQCFPTAAEATLDPAISTSISDNLITLFRTLQGVLSIYTMSHTWLSLGIFRHLLTPPDMRSLEDTKLSAPCTLALTRLRAITNELRHFDTREDSITETAVIAEYQSNMSAIDELRICFLLLPAQGAIVCFRWISNLESAFVDSMVNRRPVTMLIILHWTILLDKLGEHRWWARAAGKLLATELTRFLLDLRPEWEEYISEVWRMLNSESLEHVSAD